MSPASGLWAPKKSGDQAAFRASWVPKSASAARAARQPWRFHTSQVATPIIT